MLPTATTAAKTAQQRFAKASKLFADCDMFVPEWFFVLSVALELLRLSPAECARKLSSTIGRITGSLLSPDFWESSLFRTSVSSPPSLGDESKTSFRLIFLTPSASRGGVESFLDSIVLTKLPVSEAPDMKSIPWIFASTFGSNVSCWLFLGFVAGPRKTLVFVGIVCCEWADSLHLSSVNRITYAKDAAIPISHSSRYDWKTNTVFVA